MRVWPLARRPCSGLPPPACTGLRSACQEDGHRGVAASQGERGVLAASLLATSVAAPGSAAVAFCHRSHDTPLWLGCQPARQGCQARTSSGLWPGRTLGVGHPQTPARPGRVVENTVLRSAVCRRGCGSLSAPALGFQSGPFLGVPACFLLCGTEPWSREPRSPPLLFFFLLEKRRNVISGRSCVKARPHSVRCCAALTPAPSDWAALRQEEEKQKLQRGVAHATRARKAYSAQPVTKNFREAQSWLETRTHNSAAHSTKEKSLEETFF